MKDMSVEPAPEPLRLDTIGKIGVELGLDGYPSTQDGYCREVFDGHGGKDNGAI